MKVTSPWRRLALPLCLAGSFALPLLAQEPLPTPVPVPAAEPAVLEPTPARSVLVESPSTEAPATEPLQAVELAPPLAAPPASSSRLARVKISDEAVKEVVELPESSEATTSEDTGVQDTGVQDNGAQASGIVTELVKERHPNGSVKIEREVAQDREGNYVLHGIYRQYDERGALVCEGTHEQGLPVGVWKRYYAAGGAPLFATPPYRDFQAPFTSTAIFAEGQLNGKWTISDLKQRKISEIEFEDGQRHGKAIWFYPNGTLLSQATYEKGRVHGDVMKWGQDASLLGKEHYTHGRKLAPKVEYYDAEHKRSEILYMHAPLVVKTFDNFHSATLAAFEQRGADEKYGPFRIWHPNGQLARAGEFRYNLPVGKAVWFYSNGQKQMEGEYVDGKQQGTWTWWHQNGLKQIQGDYHDGVAVGKWHWWKEDGKLANRSDMTAAKVANIPAPMPEPEEGSLRR